MKDSTAFTLVVCTFIICATFCLSCITQCNVEYQRARHNYYPDRAITPDLPVQPAE